MCGQLPGLGLLQRPELEALLRLIGIWHPTIRRQAFRIKFKKLLQRPELEALLHLLGWHLNKILKSHDLRLESWIISVLESFQEGALTAPVDAGIGDMHD